MYAYPRPRRGQPSAPVSHRRLSPHPHHPPSRPPPGRPAGVQRHVPDRVRLRCAALERQLWGTACNGRCGHLVEDTQRRCTCAGGLDPRRWRLLARRIRWHGNSAAVAFAAPRVQAPERTEPGER